MKSNRNTCDEKYIFKNEDKIDRKPIPFENGATKWPTGRLRVRGSRGPPKRIADIGASQERNGNIKNKMRAQKWENRIQKLGGKTNYFAINWAVARCLLPGWWRKKLANFKMTFITEASIKNPKKFNSSPSACFRGIEWERAIGSFDLPIAVSMMHSPDGCASTLPQINDLWLCKPLTGNINRLINGKNLEKNHSKNQYIITNVSKI